MCRYPIAASHHFLSPQHPTQTDLVFYYLNSIGSDHTVFCDNADFRSGHARCYFSLIWCCCYVILSGQLAIAFLFSAEISTSTTVCDPTKPSAPMCSYNTFKCNAGLHLGCVRFIFSIFLMVMFYGAASGFVCSLLCVSCLLCSVDSAIVAWMHFWCTWVSPLGINKVF